MRPQLRSRARYGSLNSDQLVAAQWRRQPHLDAAERLDRASGTREVLLDEVVALVEWEPRVELDAYDLEPVIRDDAGAVGRPAGRTR